MKIFQNKTDMDIQFMKIDIKLMQVGLKTAN